MSSDSISAAVDLFRKDLASGMLAHAYVIAGPPRAEAGAFADAAIELLYRGAPAFNRRAHPDILRVEPEKKSRIIGVDQIRDVRQRFSQTSYAGGWKTCVVIAADRLNEESSNAFLKTLEEPAGKTIFFLLTDQPDGLLPTVRSRCRKIAIANVHDTLPPEYRSQVEGILAEGAREELLCGASAARRVAAILAAAREKIKSEVEATKTDGDDDETIDARVSARYREVRTALLRFLILWQRDLLMGIFGVDGSLLHNGEHEAQIREQSAGLTAALALRRIDAVESMRDQFERNLEEPSVLSSGFYTLTRER